jgi:sulfofructosephosphate aldolase
MSAAAPASRSPRSAPAEPGTPPPTTLAGGSPAPSALARPSGRFAMVAMDQRDSLRTMMAAAARRADGAAGAGAGGGHGTDAPPGASVPDGALTAFKLDVARALGPAASALLIDHDYGYRALTDARVLPPSCAKVLAVDTLDQRPGGPVEDTGLDEGIDIASAAAEGTRALKLLVIWRRDGHRDRRTALAARFVERCRAAGLASVLEPVARPTPEEETAGSFRLNDAIAEAARELAPLRPSLYKCQVPYGGSGTVAEIAAQAERIDEAVDVPWVVLSQGVAPADFPRAVEAACRAGASGFLAGRALWTDALDAEDRAARLQGPCVERLRSLAETVDAHGRPWWQAPAAVAGRTAGGEGAA